MNKHTFSLNGKIISFESGQTILQAAMQAGCYLPYLCYHPDLEPHGSCKICSVQIGTRVTASCTALAQDGLIVKSDTETLKKGRLSLIQMLFVEGNHFCPSCEKSGDCQLQATAYELNMMSQRYPQFFPNRPVDSSHPDFFLDTNRCILCSLCVHASRDIDHKNVFGLSGRGSRTHLIVNAASGKLGDTNFSANDKAAHVCPVGVILPKHKGFEVPIGRRTYDLKPIHLITSTDRKGK